jgi:hypothetical protein
MPITKRRVKVPSVRGDINRTEDGDGWRWQNIEGLRFTDIAPDGQRRTQWWSPLHGGYWFYCVNRVWHEAIVDAIPIALKERLLARLEKLGIELD